MFIYNIDNLRAILSRKNVIRYFVHLTLFFTSLVVFLFYLTSSVYQGVANDYFVKIETIDKTEGLDINLMCNVIGCDKVYFKINTSDKYNYDIFKNNKGFLVHEGFEIEKPKMLTGLLSEDYETIIPYKGNLFFINDSKYFDSMFILVLYASIVFFFMFSISFFIKLVNEYKESIIEKKNFTIETEGKLQRDLTESLNHELNMPVALIDTLINDLYSYMYPCSISENGICDFRKEKLKTEHCHKCRNSHYNREVDQIAMSHYYDMQMAIERITNVLNLISGAKHIKYNNGTISLYEIAKNIVDSNNSFKVNKVTAEYENLDLLKFYATGEGLSNGDLLNALHVMIMNSLEAKASKIKFRAEKLTNTMLNLYVEDDGRGVRDDNDHVISTTDIFNYGYSTKELDGSNKCDKLKWWQKLTTRLGLKFNKEKSPRGVGLSINKGIIEKAGGSMVLYKTTSKGTIFKLTIPIKVRKDAVEK